MPSPPASRDPLRRIGRVWRTLAPLAPQQHVYRIGAELRRRVWRPLLPAWVAWADRQPRTGLQPAALAGLAAALHTAGQPQRPLVTATGCSLAGVRLATLADIPQRMTDLSPLAVYEAHYLQWLQAGLADAATRHDALAAWRAWQNGSRALAGQPVWSKAWEPYPRARRVLACLRAAATEEDPTVREGLLAEAHSAALGLAWLAERHLDGNHLLANRLAQAAAGAVWRGAAAVRAQALAEAERQFGADGGHVEGSPMYHAVCLEDILTVHALLGAEEALHWQPLVQRATSWLADVRHPDGRVPGFGDSDADCLDGLHLVPARLAAWQRDCSGAPTAPFPSAWVAGAAGDRVIVHTADVAWRPQPGHAHDDALSLEVSLGGVRWLADAGLGGYEGDPHRALCRSRASHSTVEVPGKPNVELWSAFRVAARGEIRLRETGTCDGWRWLRAQCWWPDGQLFHQRIVAWKQTGDGGHVLIGDGLSTGTGIGRLIAAPSVSVAAGQLWSGTRSCPFAASAPLTVACGVRFRDRRRSHDGDELRYSVGTSPVWFILGASTLPDLAPWQTLWHRTPSTPLHGHTADT